MPNEVTIKYDNLELLIAGGKSICLNPQGEEILIKLLELKDQVDSAIEKCKDQLAVAIQEIDPDMTSVSADNVKVMYRVYGAKYKLDENCINEMDSKFYTVKTSYAPNSKEIDNEIKNNGVLPNGVVINERKKTVSITLKSKTRDAGETL